VNELIRTLVRQAEEYAGVRHDRFRDTPLFNTCRDTKFTELIVRKCCDIADEVERANMDSYVSKYIKAHFGVEEC